LSTENSIYHLDAMEIILQERIGSLEQSVKSSHLSMQSFLIATLRLNKQLLDDVKLVRKRILGMPRI